MTGHLKRPVSQLLVQEDNIFEYMQQLANCFIKTYRLIDSLEVPSERVRIF